MIKKISLIKVLKDRLITIKNNRQMKDQSRNLQGKNLNRSRMEQNKESNKHQVECALMLQ